MAYNFSMTPVKDGNRCSVIKVEYSSSFTYVYNIHKQPWTIFYRSRTYRILHLRKIRYLILFILFECYAEL